MSRLFYAFGVLAALYCLFEIVQRLGPQLPDSPRFLWVRPVEMAVIAGVCFGIARALGTSTRPHLSIPKAVLLPGLFLIVALPIAMFVVSGAGTHMSPLLLYPFALPWVLLFRESQPGSEIQALLFGSGINALLVTFAGVLLDRRKR